MANLLTVVAKVYLNTLFYCKNVSSFCNAKAATHIFSAKNINVFGYLPYF